MPDARLRLGDALAVLFPSPRTCLWGPRKAPDSAVGQNSPRQSRMGTTTVLDCLRQDEDIICKSNEGVRKSGLGTPDHHVIESVQLYKCSRGGGICTTDNILGAPLLYPISSTTSCSRDCLEMARWAVSGVQTGAKQASWWRSWERRVERTVGVGIMPRHDRKHLQLAIARWNWSKVENMCI
jgi:hypothetical protein